MDGILIVDKPEGMTSHDVVDFVRRRLSFKKVGHSGTLDPLATGVLVMLLGKCTRLFSKFSVFGKEYIATLTLGSTTTTGDKHGKVIKVHSYENIGKDDVLRVFLEFVGKRKQVPPMVSAVRVNGRRLYQLAREGKEIKREPRDIEIYSIELLNFNLPDIEFYVSCSKGTYIRRLAEEMAESLNCGGCISKIRRISLGPFNIKEAIDLNSINETHIRPWQS